MKKIIYLLSLVTVFILGSCSDDLPKASWDICQVGTLNATAQNEKVLLEWAPMQGANPTGYLVNWTPEVATYEGGSAELDAKTTSYTITGLVNKVTYTITIQAIYGNQRSMISTTKARPVSDTEPFKVWSTDMPNGGMVKTANAVFSLDGNTFYLPSAGATGDVTAFDAMTGTVKWTAAIPKTTYGGGVAVGKDGTLYQGARNATLYAINSDGTQKWTYATGAANKNLDCFPAVTADGQTVYILDGDNVLHSINTATGVKNWSVKLAGTKNKAGAVAIDKSGNIYFTDKGDKALYSVDKAGQLKWKFTIDAAPTYCFPVLDDKGTVYFGSGAGRIYAVNSANGEELWHMDSEGTDNNAKIMSGMTIGENQMLYVSYIGGNVAAIKIFAGPEKSTWSCRGGNIHGTNQY